MTASSGARVDRERGEDDGQESDAHVDDVVKGVFGTIMSDRACLYQARRSSRTRRKLHKALLEFNGTTRRCGFWE
jgi:hypothetical protein